MWMLSKKKIKGDKKGKTDAANIHENPNVNEAPRTSINNTKHTFQTTVAEDTAPQSEAHTPEPKREPQTDIESIGVQHDATAGIDELTAEVVACFESGTPYFRIYSSILVSCTTAESPGQGHFSQRVAQAYSSACYHSVENTAREALDAHIFELACDAYMRVRRLGQDQAIFLSGVSGSGKSASARLIADELVEVASHGGTRNTRAQRQVAQLGTIIEAFASAQMDGHSSTRVALWHELQISARGRICGSRMVAFGLDRWTVTARAAGNFNVFYWLAEGADASERAEWQLHSAGDSAYLVRGASGAVAGRLGQLRAALVACGVGRRMQAAVFRVVSAIVHLGDIEFADGEEAAAVRNSDECEVAAQLLGVDPRALQGVLVHRTALVGRDLCTVLLNAHGASEQRDAVARTLYQLVFCSLIEALNANLADGGAPNYIALMQMYGFDARPAGGFVQFAVNAANEKLHAHVMCDIFDDDVGVAQLMRTDGVEQQHVAWTHHIEGARLMCGASAGRRGGIIGTAERHRDGSLTAAITGAHGAHPRFVACEPQFGIRHFVRGVRYDAERFAAHNADLEATPDLHTLLCASSSRFVAALCTVPQVALDLHPDEPSTVVGAFVSSRPAIRPMARRGHASPVQLAELDAADPATSFAGELSVALDDVFAAAAGCTPWHVLHIRPDDPTGAPGISPRFVRDQVAGFGLVDIVQRRAPAELSVAFIATDFDERYAHVLGGDAEHAAHVRGWQRGVDYDTGRRMVFLTERVWHSIECELRSAEKRARDSTMLDVFDARAESTCSEIDDASWQSEDDWSEDSPLEREELDNGSEPSDAAWAKVGAPGLAREGLVEELDSTRTRRCWSRTTHTLTWVIPDWAMSACGMKRADIRMAWREKVAICLIIFAMWAFVLFFIVGLGLIMCPKQYVYNLSEVADHTERDNAFIALRGRVYDITNFLNQEHGKSRGGASPEDMLMYAGHEVNASFPLPLRVACPGLVSEHDDPHGLMYLKPDAEIEASFPFIHKAGTLANSKMMAHSDFYFRHALPKMRLFRLGDVVWEMDYVRHMHHKEGAYWRVIHGEVFNLSPYFTTRDAPENIDAKKWHFLHRLVESIFEDSGARDTDITRYWNILPLARDVRAANLRCMRNLFYVGRVDTRHSFRCLFPNFLLLAAACLLMLVILIKFLASLQLASRRKPQKHDKFVICQVPCYTEGEASLRRTIDSLATLSYDDKHRLLFIICDGNIVGSGNDRPTPRIVLDILGVDAKLDPPARSFRSIGEGGQQHNMAKVYSGLYEYEGHVVPYLVVAKIGKPTEKSRPGNRGKRDSQMLLLHFLNRVHFDAPMSPVDLEIYHQMKNVIGVHPSLYEYLLMVDADTEVMPDSLTRLVACMVHDAKVIGICGETQLTNEDFSWTTMIQVYEYFISHHMAKAFESLFGSVTCLPGCFCMYRLRTQRGLPLIISKNVINDYSENHVDTLHKKNLLSLGEDRYLTTLMMKYFSQYKMTFTADAQCRTTAPDTWSILLSQRRRWINSTIHNLVELVFLPEMCGFCCFSMRFVVFIDLLGTLTMPCTLFYLAYLAYLAVSKIADIGYISLILIAAIYGLQAVIFVLKRQWQHIGWMIIYLLAYPLWSFFIPIYAFWHMDDFSWGNTRIVVGEDGKRQIFVKDEDPFDPTEIQMRTWADYEREICDQQIKAKELEAVANAINKFGAEEVRPISRFTGIAGVDGARSIESMHRMSVYPMACEQSYYVNMPALDQPGMVNGDSVAVAAVEILREADLTTVTLKQVRDEISMRIGVDLEPHKEAVNAIIHSIISGNES